MLMMLRFIRVWLLSRLRRRIALDQSSRLPLRVWPDDLDLNFHMNNARYFSNADLGRLDWWVRTGLWQRALARGWRPLAGDASARYSRSLQPFQRYELHTRLLGWNSKWFFAEHRFVARGGVYAVLVVRYLFLGRDGSRPRPEEVLALVGWQQGSPPLPRWVELWDEGQERLSAELKREATPGSAVLK